MRRDYTFEEDEFEEISDIAKDFIDKLLVVNQEHRMSAEEALSHPWLNSSTTHSSSQSRKMSGTSTKLTNVVSRLKWQKRSKLPEKED